MSFSAWILPLGQCVGVYLYKTRAPPRMMAARRARARGGRTPAARSAHDAAATARVYGAVGTTSELTNNKVDTVR
jgi:hypothetical protein